MVPLRALSLLLAVCTIHGFKKEKVDMLMPQVRIQNKDFYHYHLYQNYGIFQQWQYKIVCLYH
jgi:hypothetical protein